MVRTKINKEKKKIRMKYIMKNKVKINRAAKLIE